MSGINEQEILKFWREKKIFEKSLEKKAPRGDFIFYDGPPFANGLPHYGHILASIIKDVIPRYKTMQGFHVPRKWGWDCHGLPVEYEIEKELNLKTKKDIEQFGIEKFNKEAQKSVLKYADEWRKIIPRLGRFVDMEHDYRTMDAAYTESIWWVFKTLYEKGLIYEGRKPMHICPRCETTLSNFEVNQPGAYKDITDISVTVKFELIDGPNTFLLAWTTTPWTLPGNVALAVNPDVDYVKILKDGKNYILAKKKLEIIKDEYKIIEEFRGSELVGKKYKPVFPYYEDGLRSKENAFKVYSADFVATEEGTGIVHIAPAFGEDDMNLMKKENLPFIQHVSMDGKFKREVKDPEGEQVPYGVNFAGMDVKPKGDHQRTDIEILKWLAHNDKLFAKEKIVHSYPHCWRCETPLLNYTTSSWFVKVEKLKNKLIENNKRANWIPSHIQNGRFGKWLENARDWAISRSRFWGAPIPIWRCKKCKKIKVIGSVNDIKQSSKKSSNKYFMMRHGGAEHNEMNVVSSKVDNPHHLTNKGKINVLKMAQKLKGEKIDLIISSDFVRTRETAEIVAEGIDYDKEKIVFDKRIRELDMGTFNMKSIDEYHNYFSSLEEKFTKASPEGEDLVQLKNRVTQFLYDIDGKYSDKNILIISHEYPVWLIFAGARGANIKESVEMKENKDDFIRTSKVLALDFAPLPHNENYEINLHRPYIDEIKLKCKCGGEMKRIKDIFDCWFESGSMPYGQVHYPFDPDSISSQSSVNYGARNKKLKLPKNFPAEFIAEGLDQTRGWFYTLLVLSTALFGKLAYKNVIVNGMVLAENGQKMSKRLKNYPDPMDVAEKYGADALRLYLLSSPVVRAEDMNFSEKGIDEIYKKVILRLWNVHKFYETYTFENSISNLKTKFSSENVLDRWIIARLEELKKEVSGAMEKYELDRAVRPIGEFVDDLSTWYIRRSRDRFKTDPSNPSGQADTNDAVLTTRFVLLETSKIIAPFTPFIAEAIYKEIGGEKESVHLEEWPFVKRRALNIFKIFSRKDAILDEMKEVRRVVSLGLEARAKEGIKVRQPLAELRVMNYELKKEYEDLIKDEVNVKNVISQKGDGELSTELSTEISHELKQEGQLRELVRAVQGMRKKEGLKPDQKITLDIQANSGGKNLMEKFENKFKKSVNAESINFHDSVNAEPIKIDNLEFKIRIN